MKKILLSISIILLSYPLLFAQKSYDSKVPSKERNCATMEHLEFLQSKDPSLKKRMHKNELYLQSIIKSQTNSKSMSIITIPVVVHVVYNTSTENISTSQIQSQIDVLNEDFRRLNADASNTPAGFLPVAADCEIEFCLASVDPNGNSTTGITRTSTSQSSFGTNDGVKYSSSGGIDAWNTSEYLNIWVCDISGGILGYAQFPGGPASSDGVVCDYAYFGNTGTATPPYNLGRTATHEVGHWLNLRHIWGDSNCGNDYCNDTPTQSSSNYGCPSYPSTSSCSGNGSYGDMFMNYMDYTNDNCMNMFSLDQKTRMINAINTYRSGLLNSPGCQNGSGCTDPLALNYDPNAVNDDGSCCYIAGCTDGTAINYNSSACFDDGSCTYPVLGCTDASASNYDPLATQDDGSCCYDNSIEITITTDNYPVETSWQLIDENGAVIASINGGDLTNANSAYSWDICVSSNECYDFVISDTYGDGICCSWGSGSYTVSYNGSVVASGGSFGSIESTPVGNCVPDVVGCMNPSASNYDPLANTSIAFGGIVDPNIASGAYNTGNWHLIFDATEPVKIVSAVIYSQASGTLTFEARDNAGVVIDDTTLTISSGGQRIDLNFDVPVGVDYQLGISGTNPGIYRNNDAANVNYPYDIAGLINITESSAYDPSTGQYADQYYYFFYDIEVEAVCTGISTTILGCTDPSACNYDAAANTDDGSCLTDYGCTDPTAINYDASATCDDGSCIPVQLGCTDPTAANYNSAANTDDGSCIYLGCTDPLADNYDATATVDDGSCTYSSGCSEPAITGLFIDGIIDDRVNANFDNMNTYDASGAQICRVDQIRIRYRPVGTSAWSQKNIASPTGYDAVTGICNSTQATMKPIRNLTLATTYEWQVKVWYCSGGNGGWTIGPNFTTAAECPNVGNLAVTPNNPTKATFTWDNSNGPYEFMRIKVRVDSISNPAASDWFLVGGAGIAYGIYSKQKNGLTPGETYRGQARTWCDPNGGAYNALSWSSFGVWTQPTNRIEGGESISNLDVYPNPSRDVFNITFTSELIQDLSLRVVNVVGEEIVGEEAQQFIGEYTKQISLKDYAKGIYFLEIETNNGIINKKLILK